MLTVPQAAARAGRSAETIRRWIRSGKIAATKVGTQHVIDERDLDAYVARPSSAGEASVPYVAEPAWDEAPDPLLERISINPAVVGGKPAIRGTRISVELILENLRAGWTVTEILDSYPHITDDDVRACIAYARAVIASESILPVGR